MKRTPIKRVSDRRKTQLAEYKKLRAQFLAEHPICQIWLVENGWVEFAAVTTLMDPLFNKDGVTVNAGLLIRIEDAPRATEIHHTNKRRGPMLNETQYWLALCRTNHERVESNKAWARANGYLLNF